MDTNTQISRPYSMETVEGITLTVDECGEQPPETLTFLKSKARVIAIGRKSAHAKEDLPVEGDCALFRCPVISRKHATITFTEYGNVYITDTNSHHGTHILRRGDTASRMLTSEVPSVLADGDVITFGKSVGKAPDFVRPVTVHVKLLVAPDPRDAPPLLPAMSTVPPEPVERLSPKSSTGRYGVFLPSSSDTSSSSSSDSDSDIEEVQPEDAKCWAFSSPRANSFTDAFVVCGNSRRFTIDLSRSESPPLPPSQGHTNRDAPIELLSEDDSDHLIVFPGVESLHDSSRQEPSVIGAYPRSPSCAVSSFSRDSSSASQGSREGSAQSHAPSVSHAATCNEVQDLPANQDSNVTEVAKDADLPPAEVPTSVSVSTPEVAVADAPVGVHSELTEGGGASEAPSKSVAIPPPVIDESCSLTPSLDPAEDRSAQEEVHQPLDKKREDCAIFDQRLQHVKDMLSHFEQRLLADQKLLRCEGQEPTSASNDHAVVEVSIPSGSMSSPSDVNMPNTTEKEDVMMKDDIPQSVQTLKGLIQSMEDLRTKTTKDIAQELEAIKAARVEAEAAALQAKAQMEVVRLCSVPSLEGVLEPYTVQTTTAPSLKRKRSALEEEGEGEPSSTSLQDSPVQTETALPLPGNRKRRKTMRVVSTLVQTTAIATIGAVAAWSALAFT